MMATEKMRTTESELTREEKKKRAAQHREKLRRIRRKRRITAFVVGLSAVMLIVLMVILVFFRVDSLVIEGNQRTSQEKVLDLIGYDVCYGNSMVLWLMNRWVDVSEENLIADIDVCFDGPKTIKVIVKEQVVVGYVAIGGQKYYINNEGIVIVPGAELKDVPVIEGLEVVKAEEGEALEVSDPAALADLCKIGSLLDWYDISVSKLTVEKDKSYSAQMGTVKLSLGKNIYMEEKLSELVDLMPSLKGLSGTLHLEDYNASKSEMIFTKD